MTTDIQLGRNGKDALKKACRNHPSWKRWIADNGIQGVPTKAEMLEFADHTDLNVLAIVATANGFAPAQASPVTASGDIATQSTPETDESAAPAAMTPAPAAPAAPTAPAAPAAPADVLVPIDMINEAIATVENVLSPSMLDSLRNSVSDVLAKAQTNAAQGAMQKAKAQFAKSAKNAPAGGILGNRSTPDADKIGQAKLSKLFSITGPHASKLASLWNDCDVPTIDPLYVFDPKATALINLAAETGKYLWFAGPKGSGKSTLPMQFAARTGRAFVDIGFNRWTEPQALTGSRDMAAGTTYWTDGAFVAAIRRAGAMVVLDELDKAPPATLAFLQTILAARAIVIPETGERVTFADGVTIVATSNTFGSGDASGLYVSSLEQDAALMDRFLGAFYLGYMSEQSECELLALRLALTPEKVAAYAAFAARIRHAVERGETGEPISHRALLAWLELSLNGFDMVDAFELAVQNKMRPAFAQFTREQLTAHFPKDAHSILLGKKAIAPAAPAANPNAISAETAAEIEVLFKA
jgi:MoxR-like ATPase